MNDELDEEQGAQENFGDSADDAVGTLEADLRKLQEERNTLFQQLARVQADFGNARKRLETEKQQQIQYANSNLIKSLLPVIDNFERAWRSIRPRATRPRC